MGDNTTFAEKNVKIIAALQGGAEYVYFSAEDDYYSLVGVVIDGEMQRMPAPLCIELLGGEDDGKSFYTDDRPTIPALLDGRKPVLTIERNSDMQAGDRLLADICKTLESAEGRSWVSEDGRKLTIHTTVSRDPSRSSNGGEYDFYRIYRVTPVGVVAEGDWTCDIQPISEGADIYMTAVDDLRPLLAQAQEFVSLAQRANRTPLAAVMPEGADSVRHELENLAMRLAGYGLRVDDRRHVAIEEATMYIHSAILALAGRTKHQDASLYNLLREINAEMMVRSSEAGPGTERGEKWASVAHGMREARWEIKMLEEGQQNVPQPTHAASSEGAVVLSARDEV